MSRTRETHTPLAIALRAVLAMLAVLAFLAARPLLGPAAEAGARFGLGILLFALLVDLGRSIAGTGPPLLGALAPHRQQAQTQVDEAYERLRAGLSTYLERGETEASLLDGLEDAAQAEGLDDRERRDLWARLQAAGKPRAPATSLLAVRLVSGLVVAIGLGLATALLAEGLGMALFPPILLIVGTSIATLQWRARQAGAPRTGLVLGLVGIGLFGLASLRIFAVSPAAGLVLGVIALAALLATVHATWRAQGTPAVGEDLEATMSKLRRAFLIALVAAIVLLTLQGLFEALLAALGLPASFVVELGVILLVTVLAFLAVETAGTWLTQRRESNLGRRERERRRRAIEDVLDALDRTDAPLEDTR